MADLRTKTMAALRPAAQTRMDNANVNYEADQALQASTSSEMAKGWTAAGLSEKGNAILDQANNAYRNGDAVTGKALEAEGVRTLEQARVWSPSVQRASDIDGLGSAARWGMGALASGVRSTLPSTAGALVGGALGGLATRSIRGAQLGAGALATVAGYDQMANETIGGAMMDPGIRANKSMQEIKDTGRVSGAVQAPLEALVPGLMGGAAMGLAKGLGKAGIKQAAVAGLAGGAVTEAGTEFAQDLVGQGAMNSLRDKPLTQDLDYKQALDSAAAGAVAGGGMGLAGGAMQGLHNRGAGAVDAVGDAVANPGSLLDKGAVLAGDAAGKIMNAAEGVGGKVKGKINSTLDEFIASRVVDPDRHSLLAPMTEEESNLSGQELVDRFKPKAQAWASKVLQNPSAYDEEDVADATEFGKTNDPFLLQSKLRNRMGAKAGGKSDEAIADELNPKVKSSKMSAENAEATKKAWDESTRLLAKIWHKQGIDDGIIQAVEGSEDDPIKQNAAVAVMSWVQRGFKGTDGEVIIPEQMIRAYGAKRAGKLIKNAYDLAVGQGVIDDTAEQTFDEVQARVKELGQGHEADVAKVIDNLTPIAREKIVNALSYRDKESAKAHASDLAKEIRSIVQSKSVEDHSGFLRELFGPKMNDVLDHFQPADAETSTGSRDVIAEERADFDANVEEGTGEEFDYDPAINEVDADVDSKAKYVAQSKDNEYFDMHDERHRGRFEEEVGKQSDPDTRVSKVGLVDREIEKIEEEKGRTLPPSERFKVAKRIVKERLGLTAPARLPDGAGPDQTKAHAKAVEDYERRVRSEATNLNKQYKAMRVATEKLAAPRVNFTPDQIDSIHHKNLDHRESKATIQHGVLFFDRGGDKTPYVTTSGAILREMFNIKDGTQKGTTDDFGGDAANRLELLKQGIASLLTGGDFVRVGYVKYAGTKPTWMRSNSRLPGDLTIGRSGKKGKERPLTVREAEEQEASKFTPPMLTGHGGEVAMPKKASAETKKALNALPSDPATLGGTQYETVRAQSTKEIAFKLGELLKEEGANMTKDVRGDIVKATKRFWNLEKRGEVAAGYTAERINAEVDALGLELGFDITTVRNRVESRSMEPDDIVPSEKSLGMYESETSRREDDPKTMGPDGKAINRDERGFINSGNATMVAANMAGNESTVKVEPNAGLQPVPENASVEIALTLSPAQVIKWLRASVGGLMRNLREQIANERMDVALDTVDHLESLSEMTPARVMALVKDLDMAKAERLIERAKNALPRARAIVDEEGGSSNERSVENGTQGEVGQGRSGSIREVGNGPAAERTGRAGNTDAVASQVQRPGREAVAGGAAAGRAGVTVSEHPSSGYRDRTKHNADSAGATVAIATDFDTAGEKLTKRLAGDKIVQIPIAKTPASAAKALIAHMQALGVTTLNVAGNGIYTLNEKLGVTQAQVNQYVYDTLKAAHLVVGITKIVTGGQTGVDIAGAIAAKRLGIPVDVTMPKGFLQRDMHGKDFTQTKEKVVAQIEDGARSLVDKGAVFEAQDAQGKGGTLSDALRSAESTEELFAAVESAAPLRLKPVLALLKSNLKMNQIKLKRTSVAGVGGQWDEVNRTLLINPDVLLKGILGMSPDESAATAITHELVHAATVSAIGDGIVVSIAPYSRRDAREKVDAIHVKLKDYVRRNFSELSDFERQIADKMLKNNKELVAWGMTDVTAQKLLSRIEGQDKRSLFQGLIDLVASVLGLKGVDSGLGDLLTVGAELISGNTKSSKAKAEGKALSMDSAEVQAAKDHILKTVGDKIGLKFIKAFMDGKSGAHRMGPAGQENVIRIALNSDVLGTAYHESIHEFFSMLTSGAATATKEVLLRAGKNKRLLREVSRLLDGHPEAQAQLSDPEEALAYIYQFWKAGALKIGPETKTMFQKVSEYFRNVLGLVSDEMREQQDLLNADKILTAFDQGAYGNETIRAGVMAAVNADVERQDAALKAVGEKWTTIVNKVGKLALPAEQVIEASGNKRLIKILRDFNQKTGDAMDGKASFFEAVSASRNKFMLRLENVMAKADKKDLELARQHLVKGTDPSDPVVTAIVLKTREVLDDLYKFAAERQVARWDSETHEWVGLEYRKGYFTQAWSLDELVKSGPAFKKDLLATHNAELQAIVDRAIKADPKLVVTVDDVAETILSRLLNSQGQVELDETTSDLGISPMASAVNRRSLDWLDKDVFDKYKEKDLVKIMSSYVSTMVKRAEYTDRFGRGGTRLRTAADEAVLEEIGGDELVNEAHTKLPKAIEAWRDQLSRGIESAMPTLRGVGEVAFAAKKGKDVLEAARTKALKKLGPSFKAVMALEGTLGSDIKQGMRTFNSWMMTYQNVRLLSTSLFASFSDTVGLVLNGGELGDAWDGFVRGIREIKLRWQDDKSQDLKAIRAEMWGTVDAGSSLDALGQTYGGMWMSGTARRMSDSLFKWNGMEAWNRAMRITATSVAERIIKGFKEKGFDKHDKAAVARFEELFGRGFKPEDIKLDATGELDSTDSKNQAAVSRWVNGAILRPNAAQRTVWGSDPHFQMIWHMKQFTYTFQNVILGKVIEQAKLGNYRPAMVMMAGYTPVIIAADAIKEMLIPGDEPPWMKGGLAGLIQHGVDKAGLLGIGQMGYDAMASDYGAGLTGPAVSQLLHVPMDDPSRTALGALPFGNLARRMAND